MKIGFIGLGAMGGRLADRLTGVGELTVFDASERAMEPFTGRALLGSSIAEAGTDADVVGVCVRTGAQVDDCADALLPSARSCMRSRSSPRTKHASSAPTSAGQRRPERRQRRLSLPRAGLVLGDAGGDQRRYTRRAR